MGNSKSTALKEEYEARRYRTIIQHTDPYIGSYQLIKFPNKSNVLYLRATIEPTKYDHYNCDYDLFSSKMHNGCRNICGFEFLNESAVQAQAYDLVFEFGNYINSQFQKEDVIWEFIYGVMEALIFLQAEGLHYPVLRKKFTTYVSDHHTFKLLNPFCFAEFIDKAIGVYFNYDVDLIEKADFSRQCINRNVKEFAIMVLALIKNVDESYFIRNPTTIKPAIKSLRGVYSDDLVNLLAFIIRSREMLNFIDLRNFLEQGSDRIFQSINSKDSLNGANRKIRLNDTQASLTTHHTYSEANLPRGSVNTRHNENGGQDFQAGKNYRSTGHIYPGQQNSNEQSRNGELNLNNGGRGPSSPKNVAFKPDIQDNIARVSSAVIGDLDLSQKATPSPRVFEMELRDDNAKGMKSDIQDLRGLHKTIQDISNINKIAKSTYHEALEKKMEEVVKKTDAPPQEGIIETHKDDEQKTSMTGQHRNSGSKAEQPNHAPTAPPHNKKVKRILMKWITAENKHKEFIEYEDGTMEEKQNSDPREVKNVINDFYKRTETAKPTVVAPDAATEDHKPKKSAMHFDVSTIAAGDDLPQIVNKNNYNIVLFGTEPQEPAKVIFTSSINKLFMAYDFMKGVVDQQSGMKVSKYHQEIDI